MNRNWIEIEFIYHNVGHGLFYSGEIKLQNNTTFRFIYDCGSKNVRLVSTSILRYKEDFGDDDINLLIISHLHSDHVSGLEELFNNFTIKDVILPYFSPIERLLIALRRIDMPLWYYEFLSDPVKYLIEKGVERVIIIDGGGSGERGIPPEEIPPFTLKDGFDISKLPDNEKLSKKIHINEKNWKQFIENGKLLTKDHDGYALALSLWIFRFFNYKILPSKLKNFEYCLRNQGLDVNDSENIKKIIINRKLLKRLKKCYEALIEYLQNDFNNTSLVLYHGPVGKLNVEAYFLYLNPSYIYYHCPFYILCRYRFDCSIAFFKYKCDRFGQLLTGDINLNMRYNELKRHYISYLKNVLIVQVPHHGAKKNWNKNMIKDFPNGKFWIISSGFNNRYGHPSYIVIEDIVSNSKCKCIWVNEINHMRVKGIVVW